MISRSERIVGDVSEAVDEALRAAVLADADKGAVALARRYAALIDDAQPSAVYARHLRAVAVALDPEDESAAEHFQKIGEALAAHSVASDLGPKLLAALTALGMTAAGRGVKATVKGVGGVSPGVAKRDELLRRREQRTRANGA
jgi:hypothetical protein